MMDAAAVVSKIKLWNYESDISGKITQVQIIKIVVFPSPCVFYLITTLPALN